MPDHTLSVFDPNIDQNSPAGSCLLKMLLAAKDVYRLRLLVVRTDMKTDSGIEIQKVSAPARPVLLQNVVFTVRAALSYLFTNAARRGLTISTQGACPFCDICYSHNPHKLFLTRYRAKVAGGFFMRGARLLNYRWIAAMEGIAFRRARVIVVPSQGLADELIESYGAGIAAKLRVIVNPVDCQAFVPPEDRPSTPFTFAFCALGNFEWKGLGLILDAMATGIDARLQVIGGNDVEVKQYRLRAEAAGLGERVAFIGMQRDIRPYLWAAHAFVFPSVHESFGLVCLQAAAAGLPLIATNLYALDELLLEGVSGWRVERTPASIAGAMRAALDNPEQAAAMGEHAKALAQKYDEPAFQQRWLNLLQEMVAQS